MARLHRHRKIVVAAHGVRLHAVFHASQDLSAKTETGPLRRQPGQQFLGDRLTVDVQLLVNVTNPVSGQADHAFYVVGVVLVGRKEHHDVTALRFVDVQHLGAHHGQLFVEELERLLRFG